MVLVPVFSIVIRNTITGFLKFFRELAMAPRKRRDKFGSAIKELGGGELDDATLAAIRHALDQDRQDAFFSDTRLPRTPRHPGASSHTPLNSHSSTTIGTPISDELTKTNDRL
jgi:hypothetical protein